ncbi:glycosyltransferase [Gracilibacillus halophilus YIM-C55.5]|uniref:Glycosyltransferase n=1 Tax=Gracilibacillus halophilus YIM-C55.5 TaxID=1308866 RepID=N4WQ88_9BACI|nr:glycosyltransferase family 4 protein [Gracilibacillus halophilus]ENH96610.1 glycosyltransferase [Gracilibacillus halophilus YIM-C55.5]
MKILLATYWPLPHVGGVWTYMKQLHEKLTEYGHDVDIIGYDEENISVQLYTENRVLPREKVIPLINANVNEDNYPDMFSNFLVKWTEFQRYVYELSVAYFGLEKYDLIHTQDVISTLSINRIKPANTPQIATLHGSVAHEIRRQLKTVHKSDTSDIARAYYDEVEKLGATTADHTIVANNWMKNILTEEFQVPEEQLEILHYGFNTEKFIKRLKKKPNITKPKEKQLILFTGRLVELKGVNYLIEALKELKKKRQDWVCWIVGTGEEEENLRQLTRELGLEQEVIFLGRRQDVPGIVSMADLFVLPTLIENQPLSVIEAQVAGKPVIASEVGGIPEIIEHGVTGILTPPEDAWNLYKNIDLLLSNKKYRKKLGSNAKKWGMSHWSIEKGMRNLMKIYLDQIEAKKQGEPYA